MSLAETRSAAASAKWLTIAAHTAFVPIGVATVLLGPMLPMLSARWSLNYSQAGSLFTAQFIGSTLGVVCSGILVSRRGYRFTINAGLFVMALGVAALPLSTHLWGVICIAAYGLGSGLSVPAANLLVAEVNPTRRSAALSLLNFSWSLGAVACPFLIAAAVMAQRLQLFLGLIAAFLLVALVGIAVIPGSLADSISLTKERAGTQSKIKKEEGARIASIRANAPVRWSQPPALTLAALFFLYVGTEIAFGGWLATYAKSLGSLSPSLALMSPSFFYGALMAGRWAAPLLLRRTEDVRLARVGLLTACAGMAGMVTSHALAGVVISAGIAGLGFSTVYPIMISLLSREFGAAASRAGSVMFALTNLGGTCVPWLVGFSSKKFGEIRAGLLVPLIAGALMYLLYSRDWTSADEDPRVAIGAR